MLQCATVCCTMLQCFAVCCPKRGMFVPSPKVLFKKTPTVHIGAVKASLDSFFLEGVLYMKRIGHVPISVSMRVALSGISNWSDRSGPCLVFRRDGYESAITPLRV